MTIIKKIELSEQEILALEIIERVNCSGICCNECPLEVENETCIRVLSKRILEELGK